MPYSYKPLWCMLAEHGMSKTDFREAVGLSTSTLAKLSANKPVSPDVLSRICDYFCCGLDSVATYASEMELFMISLEPHIISWKYILRLHDWPQYFFELTLEQTNFLQKVGSNRLRNQIIKFEYMANETHFPNGGIIGSTKFSLSGTNFMLEGSFAVVELLLPWIIQNTKN